MEVKRFFNVIIFIMILAAIFAIGFAATRYGRLNIYTVNYSELYMQLEWDNYLIGRWIIPLH